MTSRTLSTTALVWVSVLCVIGAAVIPWDHPEPWLMFALWLLFAARWCHDERDRP